VKSLYVLPVGNVPGQILEWIDGTAAEWFPMPTQRMEMIPIPEGSYDAKRGQYQSVEIMKAVAQKAPGDAARVLGITEVDLAIPTLTFLFGQAQLEGTVAVVPADEALLRERVVKEVLHELGHTFGLTHCHDPKCVMSLATHVGLVDSKEERYCTNCGMRIARRAAAMDGERT